MKSQILLTLLILLSLTTPVFAELIISDVKLVDRDGNELDIINAETITVVSKNFTNNGDEQQIFVSIQTVEMDNTFYVGWITGGVDPNESYVVSQSIPPFMETDTTYDYMIIVLDKVDDGFKNLLYPILDISFTTGTNSTSVIERDFTFTPNTDESPHQEFTVDTELSYFLGNTITISGNVSEIPEIGIPSVGLFVTGSDGFVKYVNAVPINSDWTYEFNLDLTILDEDEYTFQITSGDVILEFPVSIIHTIQTDKSTYYMNSIITVSGILLEIDQSGDLELKYIFYDEDGIEIAEGEFTNIINLDDTFEFTLSTINQANWEFTGTVDLHITVQNRTAIIQFEYINEPDMTNEALYNEIINIYTILATLTDNENIDLNIITDIQKDIESIHRQHHRNNDTRMVIP